MANQVVKRSDQGAENNVVTAISFLAIRNTMSTAGFTSIQASISGKPWTTQRILDPLHRHLKMFLDQAQVEAKVSFMCTACHYICYLLYLALEATSVLWYFKGIYFFFVFYWLMTITGNDVNIMIKLMI